MIPPYTTTTPWIASALSLIVLGYAVGEITFALQQSLEVYIRPAAADERSVRTAVAFLQGIVAGGGVLVAEVLYTNLNDNVATSVFAAIATVMGLLLLSLVYGDRRREGGGGVGEEARQRGLLEKRRQGEERREQRSRNRRYTGGSGDGAFTVEIAGGWTPYPYPCIL